MRRNAALFAATAFLAGCSVGPKYSKPSVPAAPAYTEQPPVAFKESDGWKLAQPGDSKLRADWWQMFGDPELNELESQIDVSNQTIKTAEARFRQARAAIRLNRSGLFPTIRMAPSITGDQLSQRRALPSSVHGAYGDFSIPFDFSYELDMWGRVRRSIEAAREETQATAADLETIRLSLHAELAVDYFNLRSLDAQKRLLEQTLATFERALELTRNRFDGGLSSAAEVAQAQTQLETTRAKAIEIGVDRARYEHAIAVLMGRQPEGFEVPERPLRTNLPVIPTGLPSQLLERRPDIASAERRTAEANEQMGIARAAFFPTFLLTATGGFQAGSLVNWVSWPSRLWAVGPTAVQTLFDAGRRQAVSDTAVARYEGAIADYRQTALTSFRQVEDNLSTLRILEEEAQTQAAAVQAAQRSLDLAMNRYKGGLVTYLEVVSAQTIALENERTQLEIYRRRVEASVLLIKALGGGWDTSKLPNS